MVFHSLSSSLSRTEFITIITIKKNEERRTKDERKGGCVKRNFVRSFIHLSYSFRKKGVYAVPKKGNLRFTYINQIETKVVITFPLMSV